MLRTITPKKDTPTADFWDRGGSGKKVVINGIKVWVKGISPSYNDDDLSPYRERAAYLVDKMLKFNFVPTTVLRLIDGRLVSAQKWISGHQPSRIDPPLLRIFDYLIVNRDRHYGNWRIGEKGKIWAIDNAFSFDEAGDRYCEKKKWAVQELSKIEKARLRRRLLSALAKQKKIHEQLDCLIGKDETNALVLRMKGVLKQCR